MNALRLPSSAAQKEKRCQAVFGSPLFFHTHCERLGNLLAHLTVFPLCLTDMADRVLIQHPIRTPFKVAVFSYVPGLSIKPLLDDCPFLLIRVIKIIETVQTIIFLKIHETLTLTSYQLFHNIYLELDGAK